jgi:class 3 adenylate cyclase
MALSATHRTILVVDVEKFSDHSRRDPDRVRVHDGLYKALHQALREAGIGWDDCYHEDRGDGVLILAPPGIPKARFSDDLPYRLAEALRLHNQAHPVAEHIRLRMALNAGEIVFDKHGVVSDALNKTYRLLESIPLKEALRDTPGVLAVIASSWFYEEVIRQSEKFEAEIYQPVTVDVKETATVAWVATPVRLGAAPPRARGGPWRIRLRDSEGGIHGPGIIFCGRYAITSSDVAARALRLPSQDVAACPARQVLFDLPGKPGIGSRPAEIIFWRPARTRDADPAGLGIAGLSIAGPAVRGIDEPVVQPNREPGPRIVRLRACAHDQDEPSAWARLPYQDTGNVTRVLLSPLPESSPNITSEFCGSDVVDEQTGAVLGIAQVFPSGNSRGQVWMTPIGKIVAEWPLLRRIAELDKHDARNEMRSRPLGMARIRQLTDSCLQTPILAEARSRHQIASELPVEVMLMAPRSSVDRADLTALLWSCTHVPGALNELARMVRESPHGGRGAPDVANELERFDA